MMEMLINGPEQKYEWIEMEGPMTVYYMNQAMHFSVWENYFFAYTTPSFRVKKGLSTIIAFALSLKR